MISIFYKTIKTKTVQKLVEYRPNSWIYVESPSEKELKTIAQKFYLEESLISDALDQYEVPRIEIEDGIIYIFTRIITAHEGVSITTPFLIILRDGYLITVSNKPLPGITKFLESKITFSTTNKALLLINLLNLIMLEYKKELNKLSKKINRFSVNIEKVNNNDIIQFVSFESILAELNSSLVRMESIYKAMHTGKLITFNEDELDLVEDLMLESGQLIQISNDSIRNIVNVREAYSTIMTNNLNKIVTIFTSITVICTIPTIIGSFFGMNVPVPLADIPHAFAFIVGTTMLLTAAIIAYFVKNHWL